jgi:ATP-dependent protease Clp ATPase subunit
MGMSHQRVHQIVENAGGGRRWAKRKHEGDERACSFCGRPERKSRRLVAGPGVFICERCVPLATGVLSTGDKTETPLGAVVSLSEANARERCSFCGKRRHQVPGLATTGTTEICSECLQLCMEILAEQLA